MFCQMCESDPCHVTIHAQVLTSARDFIKAGISPNVAQQSLYRTYVAAEHGPLGKGNRVVVPHCVRDLIRKMFPDDTDNYMGHMDE